MKKNRFFDEKKFDLLDEKKSDLFEFIKIWNFWIKTWIFVHGINPVFKQITIRLFCFKKPVFLSYIKPDFF